LEDKNAKNKLFYIQECILEYIRRAQVKVKIGYKNIRLHEETFPLKCKAGVNGIINCVEGIQMDLTW
jgi:hypothetical protein